MIFYFTQVKKSKLREVFADKDHERLAKDDLMKELKKLHKLNLSIDTTNMKAEQIRLIRSINFLMSQALTTNNEGEFFESSAELMRLCASMIKLAHFANNNRGDIPYAEQALEYSLEVLQDQISAADVLKYDN